MYSLSIHFGPNAMVWALLFKSEEKAGAVYNAYVEFNLKIAEETLLIGADDFGQSFAIPFKEISGILLEDLEVTEEARIQRSLAEAHVKVKLDQRAKTDPIIRQAMNNQGPSVLTPVPRYS
jgi:hypothetical protein